MINDESNKCTLDLNKCDDINDVLPNLVAINN